MKLQYLLVISSAVLCIPSCSVEHVSKSPMNQAFAQIEVSQVASSVSTIPEILEINAQVASLTNSMATMPYVKNPTINKEIDQLKTNIQNFIYSYQAYNLEGQKRYMNRIKNGYKKLYSSKEKISEDEFVKLNHHLVKIKGNLSQLNSLPIEIPN